MKEAAKLAGQPVLLSGPAPADGLRPGHPPAGSANAEIAAREEGTFMGLGGNGAPKPKTEPAPFKSPNTDWIRRAFDR